MRWKVRQGKTEEWLGLGYAYDSYDRSINGKEVKKWKLDIKMRNEAGRKTVVYGEPSRLVGGVRRLEGVE